MQSAGAEREHRLRHAKMMQTVTGVLGVQLQREQGGIAGVTHTPNAAGTLLKAQAVWSRPVCPLFSSTRGLTSVPHRLQSGRTRHCLELTAGQRNSAVPSIISKWEKGRRQELSCAGQTAAAGAHPGGTNVPVSPAKHAAAGTAQA